MKNMDRMRKYLVRTILATLILVLVIVYFGINNNSRSDSLTKVENANEESVVKDAVKLQDPGKAENKVEETIKPEMTPNVYIPVATKNEHIPEATPRVLKSIDFNNLKGIDSTKKNWGVLLKGNGALPEVPADITNAIKKYNAFYIGDPSVKKVYFVFSASYEGGYTTQILDSLKENDVKATFFLVGQYIKDNPQLVKSMLEGGHEIGNHSMNHPCLPLVSDDRLQSEMVGLDQYFYDNFGREMKYFMPPSGEYSEKVLAAAKQMNYTSVFWSFAYLDYNEKDQKGADYAYNKVISNLHNGAVIFLHTVSKDNAQAMSRILREIKSRGYEISPLDFK